MAQRSQYWSCTPFADWIRGTPKGAAKTDRGWREWRKQSKVLHPVRFWIAEEALDAVQNFLWWPVDRIYDVKYYVNNRFVTRTHCLTADPRDIKPGQWRDLGYRFLPCLFNELVDFVELELAWHTVAWDHETQKKFNPPFYAWGWFRWRTWRSAEAGLDYLRWASELRHNDEWDDPDSEHYNKPTRQAVCAQEIMDLYHWWKHVRPMRIDPHAASGWSSYCSRLRESDDGLFGNLGNDDETPEQREKVRRMLEESNRLEEQYEQEDEDMMIRLIRVRRSLWT